MLQIIKGTFSGESGKLGPGHSGVRLIETTEYILLRKNRKDLLLMTILIYSCIGFALLLSLYMWKEAYRNKIKIEQLHFEKLPDAFNQFRLFFISDIHRRAIPESVIHSLNGTVDIVVIGGDLCERGVPIKRIEQNLRRLKSVAPTFFVWGNNDEEIGIPQLKALLQKCGVVELNNKSHIIKRQSEQLIISGVDDLGHRRDRIDKVIRENDLSFSILVSHYPEIVKKLPLQHPFSLILSGHNHGGQIRLFGWGMKPKGRITRYKRFTHLISNGYGTSCLPLRFGARAEMHVLILLK